MGNDKHEELEIADGELAIKTVARKPFIAVSTRITGLLCMMYGIMYLDRVNISMAAKAMMKEFSLTNTQMGLAFSAFFWPYFIGQLFGGWFAKLIGPKKTLAILGSVVAVSTIATGFIGGLISLTVVRFSLGCGEGPSFSAGTSAMSDWYSVRRFGFIQGMTHSAARLGMTIAPPIVAWAMIVSGWRVSFIFCGLLSASWVILWLFFYWDNPRKHPLITEKETACLPPAQCVTSKTRLPFFPLVKRIFPVTICQFCYGWGLWLFASWIPLYFMNGRGLNLKSSALSAGLTFGAGFIGDALGGLLSDWVYKRTGRKRVARNLLISVFMLASAAALYAVMFASGIVAATTLTAASFFFLELCCGNIWSVPMDITRDFAGMAAGIMNFGAGASGVISPVLIGYVLDRTHNWDAALWCSIIVLVAGAAFTFFMRPDKPFVWAERGAD